MLCAKVCLWGLHYSVLTVNPYLPKQRKHLAPNRQFQATVQKHENQRNTTVLSLPTSVRGIQHVEQNDVNFAVQHDFMFTNHARRLLSVIRL